MRRQFEEMFFQQHGAEPHATKGILRTILSRLPGRYGHSARSQLLLVEISFKTVCTETSFTQC
jgi:hypothetical protein